MCHYHDFWEVAFLSEPVLSHFAHSHSNIKSVLLAKHSPNTMVHTSSAMPLSLQLAQPVSFFSPNTVNKSVKLPVLSIYNIGVHYISAPSHACIHCFGRSVYPRGISSREAREEMRWRLWQTEIMVFGFRVTRRRQREFKATTLITGKGNPCALWSECIRHNREADSNEITTLLSNKPKWE